MPNATASRTKPVFEFSIGLPVKKTPCCLDVIIFKERRQFLSHLRKCGHPDPKRVYKASYREYKTLYDGSIGQLILLGPIIQTEVIAHEAVHVAYNALDYEAQYFVKDEEEFIAMATGIVADSLMLKMSELGAKLRCVDPSTQNGKDLT